MSAAITIRAMAERLIAIVVLGLIAAYLYLVRIAYRLDLHDGYLEVRSVLRRRRVDVEAVQEIRRTSFAIIKVQGRPRLQLWGGRRRCGRSAPIALAAALSGPGERWTRSWRETGVP